MRSRTDEKECNFVGQLEQWLEAKEGEHFEFKEAKNHFSVDSLTEYCCAFANEGGGRIVLGVTNKRPRKVVGTCAFSQPEDTRRALMDVLHLQIDFLLIPHSDGRVLIWEVPGRPIGMPVQYNGIYWSRKGDSLVPMSQQRLRSIFAEAGRDFSAEICPRATMEDLDSRAIEEFRRSWLDKSRNGSLSALSQEQLLRDAEALVGGGLTNAALILFGTREALGKYLSQAEIVFEYRSSDASGPAQERKEYRQGFFGIYEDIWKTVNLRNDLQHYQEGLFLLDIPTFAERPVREVILNAVSHRDYQLGGSIFIRQYSRRLVVESPGGLPAGVTLETIFDHQSPRNRRIAEIFAKCGLVERSGQGMNLIFEQSIKDGKPRPDFSGTDAYNVVLTLHGQVRDPRFVQFLQEIGNETTASFGTHDFIVLDCVNRNEPVPDVLRPRLRNLAEMGIVECIGRGRGARYILSRRFYAMSGKKGVYTRKRGLDRNANKALLLEHIRENNGEGCALKDLLDVLPFVHRSYVQSLLRELRGQGIVILQGHTKGARWHLRRN